ncbi:MAG: EamA family transporter [Ruminococcus sp.]
MNNILFYVLMFVSAFITAVSQIMLKVSANKKHRHFVFEYLNPYVMLSYAGYVLVLVINVIIYTKIDYRFGVVINSLSTVLIMVLSKLILKETMTKKKIIGNALIILGIACFSLF